MTSIHASIPANLQDATMAAKSRGQIASTTNVEDKEQRQIIEGKSAISLSSVVVRQLPESINNMQSVQSNSNQAPSYEDPASEDEVEISASKENDPLLSQSPALASSLRRPILAKRPLSDLPIFEPEYDVTDALCLGSSEQNIVNNVNLTTRIAATQSSWNGNQLAERSQSVNLTSRGLQDTGANGMASVEFPGRSSKRICSDLGKENTVETWGNLEQPLAAVSTAIKIGVPGPRKATVSSSSGTSSVKVKSRVGLRRL